MQGQREINGSTLATDDCAALADYAARASWAAGFQIYEGGAVADGIFVVLRGRIVCEAGWRAGRGFVPQIATAGQTFGGEGQSPGHPTQPTPVPTTRQIHCS